MSFGGGKSSGSQSDPAATTLARIAEGFATETTGLRQGLINQLSSVLYNPSGAPGVAVPTIAVGAPGGVAPAPVAATPTGTVATTAAPTGYPSEAYTGGGNPAISPITGLPITTVTPTAITAAAAPTAPGTPTPAPGTTTMIPGGGIQVPLISAAVEASRRAASKAQQGTQEELARTNLVGTPFGQRILAEGRREGNLAASQAKTDVMKSLFNIIPNFVLGQSQTALSGLSGAVGGNVSGQGKGFGAGKTPKAG